MRIVTLTTVAAFAIVTAACTNDGASNDVSTDVNLAEDTAANDVLGGNVADPTMPTDAAGFATAAAAADLYEVESAKLAATKGTSAEVKEVAGHIRTDHEKSSSDLKAAASQAKVTVNPALDAEKQGMLDQLKAASGAEFDRLFLEQQKTAHQKALALHQNYSNAGDSEPLKAFATKAATVVQGHIEHLNGIKQAS